MTDVLGGNRDPTDRAHKTSKFVIWVIKCSDKQAPVGFGQSLENPMGGFDIFLSDFQSDRFVFSGVP